MIALACLALGTLVAVVALVFFFRRDRLAARRVEELTSRLTGGERMAGDTPALTVALDRQERAVDQALVVLDEASGQQTSLERALDAIPQGVVILDAQGELVFRNEVAEGYASARHADALVEAAVSELADRARAGEGDHRVLDLFGPPRRTVTVTSTPLPGVAEPGALVVIADISELRHLESVRRDFVANISHELKTPVGALGLLAETLVAEDDPDLRARLVDRLQSEVVRVSRTIDDLLELSRIESGEMPNRTAVPVHLVVAEAIERIRPAAEQAGIEIRAQEASPRLAVLGDRRQLVSAVYNLLDNALKYSDAGEVVDVSSATDGLHVEMSVRDRGIGIPARDLERVFERFYRVDQARSRQTGGTGLGLAIVRHVMTNHEGSVRVESRLGEGSIFTLSLPSGSGPVALGDPTEEAG